MSWRKESERLRFKENKSWTEIADRLAYNFPELNRQQTLEKVRGHVRRCNQYHTAKRDEVIGIIGDLHAPFNNKNYIHFLEDTFKILNH